MRTVFPEKLGQIADILREKDVDLWLLMGRETMDVCDPALKLVLPMDVMGVSAFFFTPSGQTTALVRMQDVGGLEKLRAFDKVVGYTDNFDDMLREKIQELDPRSIDINCDLYDALTDGLTAGLFLRLQKALEGTVYGARLQYGQVIQAVRGRKIPQEIAVMTRCLTLLNQACRELEPQLVPGFTEGQVYDFCQRYMKDHDLTSSWDNNCCPLVHAGARSEQAMVRPGPNALQQGDTFHLSFGCKLEGYATDFQRTWYLPEAGESAPPQEVQHAFSTIVSTIEEVRQRLRPGMEGRELDAMARTKMGEAGFQYSRGCGHTVGMALHDGVVTLAPDNRTLGDLPARRIEKDYVFTIELFAQTSRGTVAVEEMMRVTDQGGQFLYQPQKELWLLHPTNSK